MSEHKNVTATMPMDEYLKLKSLDNLVDRLTKVWQTAPDYSNARDTRRGYGVKYSDFASLEDACNSFRKQLGYEEV